MVSGASKKRVVSESAFGVFLDPQRESKLGKNHILQGVCSSLRFEAEKTRFLDGFSDNFGGPDPRFCCAQPVFCQGRPFLERSEKKTEKDLILEPKMGYETIRNVYKNGFEHVWFLDVKSVTVFGDLGIILGAQKSSKIRKKCSRRSSGDPLQNFCVSICPWGPILGDFGLILV